MRPGAIDPPRSMSKASGGKERRGTVDIVGPRFPRFTPFVDTTTPRTPTPTGLSEPLTRCSASPRLQARYTIAAGAAGVLSRVRHGGLGRTFRFE